MMFSFYDQLIIYLCEIRDRVRLIPRLIMRSRGLARLDTVWYQQMVWKELWERLWVGLWEVVWEVLSKVLCFDAMLQSYFPMLCFDAMLQSYAPMPRNKAILRYYASSSSI